MPPAHLVIAIPSLIGSSLSLLATTSFALIYIVFPPRPHVRQVLICNLLLSDWINCLNNTISGFIVTANWRERDRLPPGPGCTANAYIGQLSVQATDFNILVIAVSVLLTIRRSTIVSELSRTQLIVVLMMPWIMPIITANIALGLHIYGPVSGNWCWITAEHFGLRYALTHGWRIAIFIITIAIYTWVYIHLKRIYGRLGAGYESSPAQALCSQRGTHVSTITRSIITNKPDSRVELRELDEMPLRDHGAHVAGTTEITFDQCEDGLNYVPPGLSPSIFTPSEKSLRKTTIQQPQLPPQTSTRSAPPYVRPSSDLRNMLLLNGYPILYVLLWIPGIANRIYEAFGPSPVWLAALQSTTQFMGIADVLTYAWNEHLHIRIRNHMKERQGFQRRPEARS